MRLAFHTDGSIHTPGTYHPSLYTPSRSLSGLGLDSGTRQIAATAAQGAATTGAILTGLANMGIISAAFGPAAPIAAAIAGLTMVGIAIANLFSGCGQTCIRATQIVEQAGPIFQDNFNHYMNSPVHFRSMQLAALNNFDILWTALTQSCSDPSLGDAGRRCISDRQEGACKWRSSPGGWQRDTSGKWTYVAPGPAGSGDTCWNVFVGLRDPIADDPTVVPDPVSQMVTGSGLSSQVNVAGMSFPLPLLLGAGGLLLMTMVSD